jgi:hypothetical protein
MLYDKNSFLPAMATGDMTIRLVDTAGAARYLIKDPDATLTVEGRGVRVHQHADASGMLLEFPSPRDAREAMVRLQAALLQLRKNGAAAGPGGVGTPPATEGFFVPVSYDRQATFNLGFSPLRVVGLYVNGQLVYENEYAVTGSTLAWGGVTYHLEPTDRVLLEFAGRIE